ncbi:MAG: DUF2703 domain-containing protein [Actinobacteria bacterium]|nr:DUF2703 domain-containing protein [Actinomycetota bacterium]
MAENWYPIIDESTCTECGTCVNFCPHAVYDTTKAPVPVVENPDGCIDQCHGCGNQCPVGAISYANDATGWVPPVFQKEESETCSCSEKSAACSCSGEPAVCSCPEESVTSDGDDTSVVKIIVVEYLYLDLETCERCMGTDAVLEEVLEVLSPALELAGYGIEYRKIEITTAELAQRHHFLSSPTVRVNGRDICQTVQENECGCCSEISDSNVDCRVFEYEGGSYEVAPKKMLAESILQNVFGTPIEVSSGFDYTLPDNLDRFFSGKDAKQNCSCGCDC